MGEVKDQGSSFLAGKSAVMLVTGGAGFIGSNFVRYVLTATEFKGSVINFDKLTYAGNLASLADVEKQFGGTRYMFRQGDVCDYAQLATLLQEFPVTSIVHFAAESHVDRSIHGPADFIETNINGTFRLLEAARQAWKGRADVRFHQISTDEVYGSLGATGKFLETTAYDPRSPYSASKAASDHLVRAYHHTYGFPVTISNCSNNYGPYQFPEKLIPLMILNALEGRDLPLYGDGKNVRDWLYVDDHCEAVWQILTRARAGETFNIGGECEKQNIEVVNEVCSILESLAPAAQNTLLAKRSRDRYTDLITPVADRPGHDRRYAINCEKIKNKLGWKPRHDFTEGLRSTVHWYLTNAAWVEDVRSGEYRKWIDRNYASRSGNANGGKE